MHALKAKKYEDGFLTANFEAKITLLAISKQCTVKTFEYKNGNDQLITGPANSW